MFWQRLVVLFVNSSQLHQGVTFNLITLRSTFFYNILIIPCTMQFCRPYWETILLNLMTLVSISIYNIPIAPCFKQFCRPYVGEIMFRRKSNTSQVCCSCSGCNYKGRWPQVSFCSVQGLIYLNYLLQDNYADLQLVLVTCKPLFEKLHLPPGLCHF